MNLLMLQKRYKVELKRLVALKDLQRYVILTKNMTRLDFGNLYYGSVVAIKKFVYMLSEPIYKRIISSKENDIIKT